MILPIIEGNPTDEEIAQMILATFIKAEAHECCEWFRVKGRMVCNPHAESPLKYAVHYPMPVPYPLPPFRSPLEKSKDAPSPFLDAAYEKLAIEPALQDEIAKLMSAPPRNR